ncbi:MAG: glycosyl transferase, partial [Desulfatitalea sp.]|nr:glycosyl transferase [Desulfatitalea sp.]NNK02596.1 glycosyl transferase [Desulfatitalea sp.]
MSHVTISDHNTIDGALAIAHLPGTFISEEITTYFPESGCKVHVLALNINESQHWDIQKVRSSIFDLAIYLKEQNILSVVAHPLYAVNDKLTLDDFEKMLLLFENFELNGARNARENETLRKLMGQLHEKDIADLAEKHSIEPLYPISRQKRLWGGSDDHSALNIARTYTRIKNVNHPQLLRGDGPIDDIEAICRPATPLTMAHNLYGIAYQYYCSKFGLGRYRDKDELMRFLDRNLRVDYNRHPGLFSRLYLFWNYHKEKKVKEPVSDSLMSLLRHETSKLIHDDPRFFEETQRPVDDDHQEKRWYAFVNRTSKRVMVHFGDNLMGHLSGANFFNIFSTIGSAGGLYTLMAPYFVAYAQFAKDR